MPSVNFRSNAMISEYTYTEVDLASFELLNVYSLHVVWVDDEMEEEKEETDQGESPS